MFKQFIESKNKYGVKTALYYHIPLFFTVKWKWWDKEGIYSGFCLAPFIFYKSKAKAFVLRHEIIHWWQQVVFTLPLFGVIYGVDYIIKLIMYRDFTKAYEKVIFEKYAYSNDDENLEELARINDITVRLGKDVWEQK